MKKKTTIFKMRIVHVLSCFLLTLLCSTNFYGQTKEYATSQSNGKNAATILLGAISGGYNSTTTNAANVATPANAVDGNETTAAVMEASNISILGLAQWSGEAWLQMNFPSTSLPGANTTT